MLSVKPDSMQSMAEPVIRMGAMANGYMLVYMGHYQKMEQSLSLMVFSQARCPRFAFSMYNISFRGALLEPHAISRFRVRYLQKRDAKSAILSIFTVSLGQDK